MTEFSDDHEQRLRSADRPRSPSPEARDRIERTMWAAYLEDAPGGDGARVADVDTEIPVTPLVPSATGEVRLDRPSVRWMVSIAAVVLLVLGAVGGFALRGTVQSEDPPSAGQSSQGSLADEIPAWCESELDGLRSAVAQWEGAEPPAVSARASVLDAADAAVRSYSQLLLSLGESVLRARQDEVDALRSELRQARTALDEEAVAGEEADALVSDAVIELPAELADAAGQSVFCFLPSNDQCIDFVCIAYLGPRRD